VDRSFSKIAGREVGWWILSGIFSSLKGRTSLVTHRKRADRIGWLAYRLVRSRREVMASNLCSVFPDWDVDHIATVSKQVARIISHGFVDLFYYANHTDALPSQVILDDDGVLDDLLSRGTGFVVATGHLGLFPVLGVPIVARGLPFAPVARDPHDLRLKKVFDDSRTLLGYTNVPDQPPTTVLKRSLKVLRGGGAVMITFDMRPGEGGAIEVDFLGRKTPMHSAVVRLAATTGTPIVPAHVLRAADGLTHRVKFYPPIDVPKEASDENSPITREILQTLAHWLSGAIRENPEQYWWIHRRWRELST
jgi:KDO2-lipid IV(A) lauroyltransferase